MLSLSFYSFSTVENCCAVNFVYERMPDKESHCLPIHNIAFEGDFVRLLACLSRRYFLYVYNFQIQERPYFAMQSAVGLRPYKYFNTSAEQKSSTIILCKRINTILIDPKKIVFIYFWKEFLIYEWAYEIYIYEQKNFLPNSLKRLWVYPPPEYFYTNLVRTPKYRFSHGLYMCICTVNT